MTLKGSLTISKEKLMLFYGTFGSKHLDGIGSDKYVMVEAVDMDQATRIMYAKFGERWSHLYYTPETAGIDEFQLVCANVCYEPLTAAREGVSLMEENSSNHFLHFKKDVTFEFLKSPVGSNTYYLNIDSENICETLFFEKVSFLDALESAIKIARHDFFSESTETKASSLSQKQLVV
jgi:hypothetical protein